MPEHFSMRSISQLETPSGYLFVVITDVPCHLWMRITTRKPWRHKTPVLERGLLIHYDYKLCFVTYHDNEQEEPGDTLVHTFIKEPWDICETRWFYFHGTIGGEASPSTTCFFEKHRRYVPYVLLHYEPWGHIPTFMPNLRLLFIEHWL